MENWSIYSLKKKGSQRLDKFLQKEFLSMQEKNTHLNSCKLEQALFRFSLSKTFKQSENVTGCIYIYKEKKEDFNWLENINLLSQDNIAIDNKEYNYKVLVLLKINRKIYALSYSYGYTLLENDYIVSDFGLNLSKKILNITNLKKIKNTIVTDSSVNMTATSYLPISVGTIFNSNNLNIVNEIMGKGQIKFETTNKEIKYLKDLYITGKNSVEIRRNLDISDDIVPLIKKLNELYMEKKVEPTILKNELKLSSRDIENKLIEYKLVPYLEKLNNEYLKNSNDLKSHEIKKIEIDLPLSKFDFDNQLDKVKFRINGILKRNTYIDYLEYDKGDIYSQIFSSLNSTSTNLTKNSYIPFFKKTKIDYVLDTNTGRLCNLYQSIYFQCEYQNKKYLLLHGKWYFIEKDFWKILKKTVDEISDQEHGIKFDSFQKNDTDQNGKKSEGAYNKRIAMEDLNKNTFCLDQRNFTSENFSEGKSFATYMLNSNSKIEPCDLLKIDSEYTFCHIKKGSTSSTLSHLITQTKASCDLLRTSQDFVNHINNELTDIQKCEIHKKILQQQQVEKHEINVILGCIVKKDKLEQPNSKAFPVLFNIVLASLYTELKEKGFNLSLVKIEDKS